MSRLRDSRAPRVDSDNEPTNYPPSVYCRGRLHAPLVPVQNKALPAGFSIICTVMQVRSCVYAGVVPLYAIHTDLLRAAQGRGLPQPTRHQPKKSPSNSVGARVVKWGREGLDGRLFAPT